jgi:Kelch motif
MTDDFNPDERWFAHLLASVPTPASFDSWADVGTGVPQARRRRRTPAFVWGGALAAIAVVVTGLGLVGPALHRGGSTGSATPPPRSGAGVAADDVHQFIVLFGGRSSDSGLLGDTWTWDGRQWTERHPSHSPSPRSAVAMSTDPDGGGVLLVGGVDEDGRVLSDNWEWDGADWRSLPVQPGPARAGAVMTFDPIAGHIVLVGGQGGGAATTWVRTAGAWEARVPDQAPPSCASSSMAYDDAVREVVLVTVHGCGGQAVTTWTWDGHAWTRQSPDPSPPPAAGSALAYDDGSQQLVLFSPGPDPAHPCLGRATWTWDGFTWTAHPATLLPAAASSAVADPVTRRPLLLTVTGETWRWDGTAWGIVQAASSTAAGQRPPAAACAGGRPG